MRSARNLLIVLIAIAAVAVVVFALTCNGGAGDESGIPNTPTQGDPDVEVAVDTVLTAIRERDRATLSEMVGGQLRERIQEQDLDRAARCVPEGASVNLQEPVIETVADQASATLTFEVTQDGQTNEVTVVWNFERESDAWVLKELPACPFQAP